MLKYSPNIGVSFLKLNSKGISLVETMVGLVLFFLLFGFTFKAFAPAATDGHNLLRGVTIAMNAGNWYLNELERKINYNGALESSEIGEKDVSHMFTEDLFSDIAMLRSLRATSKVSLEGSLYTAKIYFKWGNHDSDEKRTHNFDLSRLIVQPSFD